MKKILLPVVFAASTVLGVAGLANASAGGVARVSPAPTETTLATGPDGKKIYPPETVVVLPPAPPLTVPPVAPLPVTGSDSSSTLAIGAVALGLGGGLVLVARSRRRRPQPTV